MNNIKTRFQLLHFGSEKPFSTIYEHEQLLATLHETETELKVGSIMPTDNGDYKIVEIILNRHEDDIEVPGVGVEMARYGDRLPYNFEVRVYLEKI